jgi:CRP/FNR family transcriptional regulator
VDIEIPNATPPSTPPMTSRFSEFRTAAHAAALRASHMFASAPPEDLERIAAFVQPRSAAKGSYLFREGQPSLGFYIVRRGAVSVQRTTPDGREKVIHVFRRGESFAEAALASEGGYPADALAVEASDLLFVPKAEFLELIKTHADLALRMLASMSYHLRILVNALEDVKSRDVESRLVNWLLKRCPQPLATAPVEIMLDVTKTVLASELGTRNETLSRAFAKLRRAGQIRVAGKRIRVLDPTRLAAQVSPVQLDFA